MSARLSVIIPILDEEAALPACLASVAAQVGFAGEVETIVVDGGSQDAGPRMAADAGATVLSAPRGRGVQMRHGAEAANGELLLFVHADTVLPSDAFAAIARALTRPGVRAGSFRIVHTLGPDAGAWTRGSLRLADRRSWRRTLPYGDQAIFVTRELYREVGGMPVRPLMEDIAFARALAAKTRLERLPQTVYASGRRFEQRPIRTTLCWWTFPVLDRIGVSPRILSWLYGRPRRDPSTARRRQPRDC